jgi:two-component system, sensor histidine kinase and response regulator
MTALAMEGDRERCLAAGMDGYISKPIDFRQLDQLLGAYAERASPAAVAAEKSEGGEFPLGISPPRSDF